MTDCGLEIVRLKASVRDAHKDIKTFLVRRTDTDHGSCIVEWVGGSEPKASIIRCLSCGTSSMLEPDCAHQEALRVHLGVRE